MPVLRDWELAIDADKVLWGQGADPAIIRARRPKLVAAAEEVIELGRPLLAPVVLYQRIPVVGLRHERLLLAGGGTLFGSLIASHLATTSEVIVAVCTVGDGLANTISELFQTDPVQALAFEGLAAAAAEALGEAVCRYFESVAATDGMKASIPLNPGMIGWPLEEGQKRVFLPDRCERDRRLAGARQHHAATEIPLAGRRPGPRCRSRRSELRLLLHPRYLPLQGSLWPMTRASRPITSTWSRSAAGWISSPGRLLSTLRAPPASRWWRCAGRGLVLHLSGAASDGPRHLLTAAERDGIRPDGLAAGFRLACQTIPLTDVKVEIPPDALATQQRLQLEGQEVGHPAAPLIEEIDITVELATLGDLAPTPRASRTPSRSIDGTRPVFPHAVLRVCRASCGRRSGRRGWACAARGWQADGMTNGAARPDEVVAVVPAGARLLGLAVDIGTTKIAAYLVELATGARSPKPAP